MAIQNLIIEKKFHNAP